MEIIKIKYKGSHLNQFIPEKLGNKSLKSAIILFLWQTIYQYHSYKAETLLYTTLWFMQTKYHEESIMFVWNTKRCISFPFGM